MHAVVHAREPRRDWEIAGLVCARVPEMRRARQDFSGVVGGWTKSFGPDGELLREDELGTELSYRLQGLEDCRPVGRILLVAFDGSADGSRQAPSLASIRSGGRSQCFRRRPQRQ